MRFDCGLTAEEKFEREKEWHVKFAWLPKRVGHRRCVWLEKYWRKRTFTGDWHHKWDWEYKEFFLDREWSNGKASPC